jgi:hypothetical protein
MAKDSLQTRYRRALEARGEEFVKELKGCVVMTRIPESGSFYFLGSAGSVRFGSHRTGSIPVSDAFKERLLSGPCASSARA